MGNVFLLVALHMGLRIFLLIANIIYIFANISASCEYRGFICDPKSILWISIGEVLQEYIDDIDRWNE